SMSDAVKSALRESDRSESRRGADAFLAAGVAYIDAGPIDRHGMRAERGDGVDYEERASLTDEAGQTVQVLQDAGAGLRVNYSHCPSPPAIHPFLHLLR